MTSQDPLKGTERHKRICGHCNKKCTEKGKGRDEQKNKTKLYFLKFIFL